MTNAASNEWHNLHYPIFVTLDTPKFYNYNLTVSFFPV
jgi:hypothetical protein